MKIIHISDLHKTSSFFIKEWGNMLIDQVNKINPELLIISGDITDNGYYFEYEEVVEYLNAFKIENMIIVPGNHDARNEGYLIFEKFFKTRYPQFENNEIIVLGLDSSEPDLDDGHIGRSHYKDIENSFKGKNNKIKAITLHHHLIPIPGTGRERHIPVDSGDMLKLMGELDVNFVFSGHKHMPWIWNLNNTYFINSGTSATRKLKGMGYPSYNIVNINNEDASPYLFKVRINEINLITEESKMSLETIISPGD